ncbi:histidinolphosphatase-like protein [Fusarium austroafricanum]|uniref:Histidinolphosphatase-like protein n=1 Tax=Fusarium austroafricanum TaxID=2364996 RepID=A0A8H4K9I8_9HYPO|nr:histidinolphosphatase-like protein [Fusarium austroafricanum]
MADPKPIKLNPPTKYSPSTKNAPPVDPPTLDWLTTTWSVTHSTLSMWRDARNVRITYKMLPGTADGRPRIDDLVEYEPLSKDRTRKTVQGIDIQASSIGWDWRGKGWLMFVHTHWELLGWGESITAEGVKERWAVTWFAPTVFTKEGVDIYCDRKEGLSEETYAKIREALKGLETKKVVEMVEAHMQPVEIRLPWVEE